MLNKGIGLVKDWTGKDKDKDQGQSLQGPGQGQGLKFGP